MLSSTYSRGSKKVSAVEPYQRQFFLGASCDCYQRGFDRILARADLDFTGYAVINTA